LEELKPAQFRSVQGLFDAMGYHLAVNSIFAGQTPARIFVDDTAHPSVALAWAGHRFHLAGSPHNADFNTRLGNLFSEMVYPFALAHGEIMFTLYYAPEQWADKIESLLPGKFPMRAARQYYAFPTTYLPRSEWRSMLPSGISLHNVDEAILAQTHLQRLDELREEMCSERPSVQDFMDKSFGVCLVRGDELAGWCLSEYNSPERCEVGIETALPYRKQGLGTLMTLALVELARSKGVREVGWHCYASNTASIATALKAGFHLVCDYPTFFAWFNEVDNLVVHGNICLDHQQYSEAAGWYEQAFAQGEAKSWGYWNAACNAAELGRHAEAFSYLARAIEKDHSIDADDLQHSEHLRSLHTTPEWATLVAQRGHATS
jgi:RimJ/RimL family protein N-acetyltransferase